MQLVGRDRELAHMARMLERAASGSGAVLVLTGPRGAGKTALADAGVARARAMGFDVVRASLTAGQPTRLAWAQLLRDVGGSEELVARLLEDPGPLDLDSAARNLASGGRRLLVVEDVDDGGAEAIELLAVVAARVANGATAVLASASRSLGVGDELRVGGLEEAELAIVVPELEPQMRRAVWLASRGLPGVARLMAADLDPHAGDDAIAVVAVNAPATSGFLDLDVGLIRLLEEGLRLASSDDVKARVMARLARELLGDASAGHRRRALVDGALALARRSGDRRALAEALDARLHALWDPAAAEDRLAAASEIIDLGRATADGDLERRGLFWRFVALMELARVDEAESVLATFATEAAASGDAGAAVMVAARFAMLATLRGRFEQAEQLIEDVADAGRRIGLADTDRLLGTLRGAILFERGGDPKQAAEMAQLLVAFARRNPGHYYEATAARALVAIGRRREAATELQRVLPRALGGSGPRWLGAMADLAAVAAAVGDDGAAGALYEVLVPYRGRLVVWGGANTTTGPVSHYLGLLAAQLGRFEVAIQDLEDAIALDEAIGALPFLAHSLAALAAVLEARDGPDDHARASALVERARAIAEPLGMAGVMARLPESADNWRLAREGTDWLLEAAGERVRLRDSRGLHYLRALLASPGQDVAALDLAAGGAGLVASSAGPQLDDEARDTYRRKVAALDAALDASDRAGDPALARRLTKEREAVVAELRRATSLGGRARGMTAEAERARVNVTRTLRATVERIAEQSPLVAAHLDASLRTGRACRYDPAPGGPAHWKV